MSTVYQTVISIISKPIELRDDSEINSVLVWFTNLFRKKTTVFGDVSQEVIRDIIKNCSFETKKRDDIIIKQGDKGDCFYVNLRGKVSIYINHKQHDFFDTFDNEAQNESTENVDLDEFSFSEPQTNNKVKSIRDKLGNYVTSLEAGEGFGEIALISDEDRTATIISDETTDLMVVNKALYKRCLQAPTLRKLAEKQNFVNKSPFFGNWNTKMKKYLCLCLEREIVRYDSYLGKQGEPADKIYFIVKGQAKVSVDPTMHITQYPRLHPLKLPETEGQEIISTWIEEKNRTLGETTPVNQKNEAQQQRKNSQVIARRSFTFAEAEQRMKIRNIEVGILGPGEISGLCETIMEMPTYMQSTKCLEDCDVFYIYKRSYDRLIAKRNPTCVRKMQEYIYLKLQARNARLKLTYPIAFYRSLEYRLEIAIHGRKKSLNAIYALSNNASNSNGNGLKLPPRGPIIQMDIRPKTKVKSKKQPSLMSAIQQAQIYSFNNNINNDNMSKEEAIKIKIDNDDLTQSSSSSFDMNVNEVNSNQLIEKVVSEIENRKYDDKFADAEFTNDQALNELEQRIKLWHLQNGCKKPLFEAFHRVDVEKLKNNIKSGGKILLKPKKKSTNERRNGRSQHRGSGSSSTSSGSADINDSDDENIGYQSDLAQEFMSHLHPQNRSLKYISSHSLTSVAAALTGVLNGNLISNYSSELQSFYNSSDAYYDSYYRQRHHSMHQISINNNNNNNYNIQRSTNNSNLDQHEIINTNNNNNNNNNYDNEKSTTAITSKKRRSLPVKLNDNHLQEIFNSKLNDNNNNNNYDRNKPFINLAQRLSSFNIQYTPYLFRKLSMSQVKVHNTGKVYSKEEYLMLKDELRRQTRRYSLTSAHL